METSMTPMQPPQSSTMSLGNMFSNPKSCVGLFDHIAEWPEEVCMTPGDKIAKLIECPKAPMPPPKDGSTRRKSISNKRSCDDREMSVSEQELVTPNKIADFGNSMGFKEPNAPMRKKRACRMSQKTMKGISEKLFPSVIDEEDEDEDEEEDEEDEDDEMLLDLEDLSRMALKIEPPSPLLNDGEDFEELNTLNAPMQPDQQGNARKELKTAFHLEESLASKEDNEMEKITPK